MYSHRSLTHVPFESQVTLCVFKVTGETNTDDLSPAPDAWSRPDIPLHALAMLKLGNLMSESPSQKDSLMLGVDRGLVVDISDKLVILRRLLFAELVSGSSHEMASLMLRTRLRI